MHFNYPSKLTLKPFNKSGFWPLIFSRRSWYIPSILAFLPLPSFLIPTPSETFLSCALADPDEDRGPCLQTSDDISCSAINRFQDKLSDSLGCDNAKCVQLHGPVQFPDPDQGALTPLWALPQTPL